MRSYLLFISIAVHLVAYLPISPRRSFGHYSRHFDTFPVLKPQDPQRKGNFLSSVVAQSLFMGKKPTSRLRSSRLRAADFFSAQARKFLGENGFRRTDVRANFRVGGNIYGTAGEKRIKSLYAQTRLGSNARTVVRISRTNFHFGRQRTGKGGRQQTGQATH